MSLVNIFISLKLKPYKNLLVFKQIIKVNEERQHTSFLKLLRVLPFYFKMYRSSLTETRRV